MLVNSSALAGIILDGECETPGQQMLGGWALCYALRPNSVVSKGWTSIGNRESGLASRTRHGAVTKLSE